MKPKHLTYAQLHQITRNSRPKKASRWDFGEIAVVIAGLVSLVIAIFVR